MRECTICKVYQTNDCFYKCSACPDGLQRQCKNCGRKASAENAKSNRTKHAERTAKRKKKFFDKFEEFKKRLKCKDCGDERHYVLDFHHRDQETKTNTISRIKQNCNWGLLMEEIRKCDVLCANCHREHHYNDKSSYTRNDFK